MLSVCSHENLATFVGFCLKPVLLILMDYVAGGTLKDWVHTKGSEVSQHDYMFSVLNILLGTVSGLEFLHSGLQDPILHRDIKSENILLTSEGDLFDVVMLFTIVYLQS